MLLKMEKDVNASLRDSHSENIPRLEEILAGEKKRNTTTRLRSQEAVVDSRRLQPPFSDSRDVRAAAVGRAENFHSGGRATWASLF